MINKLRAHSNLNLKSETVNGLQRHFYQLSNEALNVKNIQSLNEVLDSLFTTIIKSIDRRNAEVLNQLITVPKLIYELRFNGQSELSAHIQDRVTNFYRDLIRYSLRFSISENNTEAQQKKINELAYITYSIYLDFIHILILKGDNEGLAKVLDDFNIVFPERVRLPHDKQILVRQYYRANRAIEAQAIIDENNLYQYIFILHQQSSFALRSWIYHLYDVNQVNLEFTQNTLNLINSSYDDIEDFINDFITVRELSHQLFLGIDDWHYIEPTGEVEFRVMAYKWVTFGATIYFLNHPPSSVDFNLIPNDEIYSFILSDMKEFLGVIERDFTKWQVLIGCSSIEDFNEKKREILLLFAQLKRKFQIGKELVIAESKLSDTRINDFRKLLGEKWKNASAIKGLFLYFNNYEISHDEEKKFRPIRQPFIFQKAKTLFTDENYQRIYGIEDLGRQQGRIFDSHFCASILPNKELIKFSDFSELIASLVENLKRSGKVASLIIAPPEILMLDELRNNELFVPRWKLPENMATQFVGTYNELPIAQVYSRQIRNSVIVCDFVSAFKMEILHHDDYITPDLNIKVAEITKEHAEEIYNRKVAEYKVDAEGIPLSKDNAISIIQTGVDIDILVNANFLVVDDSAYEIGLLEKLSEEG